MKSFKRGTSLFLTHLLILSFGSLGWGETLIESKEQKAVLEESLKNEIKALFPLYCPQECLDLQVIANLKRVPTRFVDPGFEEMDETVDMALKLDSIRVNILARGELKKEVSDFLTSYIDFIGKKHETRPAVAFSSITVPVIERSRSRYAMIAAALLGGLFLLAGLYLLFRRRSHPSAPLTADESVTPQVRREVTAVPQLFTESSQMLYRDDSLPTFVAEHLEGVRRVLGRWSLHAEGFKKTIQLLTQLPLSLRNELKGVLGQPSKDRLRQEYLMLTQTTPSKLKEIVKELRTEVDYEHLLDTAEIKDHDKFGFLDLLDPSHIVQLLKDENGKTRALVMLQLEGEKRSTLFNAYSSQEQKGLAIELGRIQNIDLKELRALAYRLSLKAAEMENWRAQELSGFDALVQLVEGSSQPEELLGEITQSDLKLGHRLKQQIISLDLVEWLDDDEVALFLKQLSRDDVVSLCTGALSLHRERLTAQLSSQMREYVDFYLSGDAKKKTPQSRLKEAEQKGYLMLKKLFQEGMLNLEELHKKRALWENRQIITDSGTIKVHGRREITT